MAVGRCPTDGPAGSGTERASWHRTSGARGWRAALTLLGAMTTGAGGAAAAAVPDAPVARPALAPARPRSVPLATILAEAKASGAPAVLVNVWATWCDPCREELPDLLRLYHDHRAAGLRLVLISADDADARDQVAQVLSAATARAGVGRALDATSYLKQDDDMKLIDGLDPRWSGALPATFLFDAAGRRVRSWLTPVTYADVDAAIRGRLGGAGLTKSRGGAKRKP